MKMKIEKHTFPYNKPFTFTGNTLTKSDTVRVILEDGHYIGRGEAMGLRSNGETDDTIVMQLETVRSYIEDGASREDIQDLLTFGGARNALDCAFWDLNAKMADKSIWGLLNMKPKQLVSVATIGISSPEEMAQEAIELAMYSNLKIKLCGIEPVASLEAIRTARPDAKFIVDVNQGWGFDELKEYTPQARKLGVEMIEQPLPRGADEELEGFKSPVPLGADESCRDSTEYKSIAQRYDVINIKLDKCGGLSDALKIIELSKKDKKGIMVGNMCGSSLSMAPSYVVGQFCQYVDIDGPLFLKNDIECGLEYNNGGVVSLPSSKLWG